MPRKEKVFVTEVIRSFENAGYIAIKIPDMPAFSNSKMRFSPNKPFDIVADVDCRFVAVECKFANGFKAVSKNMFVKKGKDGSIKNDQLDNLIRHRFAFIFVNFFKPREYNILAIFGRSSIIKLIGGHSITAKEIKEKLENRMLNTDILFFEGRKGAYEIPIDALVKNEGYI